jgi:hypothetical protein
MADPIIRFKRSAVPDKKPTIEQLPLGELAINTYDGRLFIKQDRNGVGIATRVVEVGAATSSGKTLYVTTNGNDNNLGLSQNDAKASIKGAVESAGPFDTIKVLPGTYVENNPINMPDFLGIEGAELRNCLVSPANPGEDLFYVSEGCHITDLSFIGQPSTNGAAVIALRPLLGVSSDRYFDAARMIRFNNEYIARESVGFLTSGFSGFAGSHREQDAARLIENNLEFIAKEAVGYLTSTDYKNPAFVVPISPEDCSDDIIDIFEEIAYDLKAKSNKKSIGAGLTYYAEGGALQHITGTDVNGYSIRDATVDALVYAIGIATHVINNRDWASSSGVSTYSGVIQDYSSYSPVLVSGGCTDVNERIGTLVGIVTSIIGIGTEQTPSIEYGVNLEPDACVGDVRHVWNSICHDITRGGNLKCVGAGKSYYDENFNLIPQILKNPGEVEQTIATLRYSFKIARSVINNATYGSYPIGIATNVSFATYDKSTGITTITATNHGLEKDDAVKVVGLGFTCDSDGGSTILEYPDDSYGYIFPVKSVVGPNTFEVVVGLSTLDHYYTSGGTVQKYVNFQNDFTQVKDLGMQIDPYSGFNNTVNSCVNVVSAMDTCIGIVTTIVGLGSDAFLGISGITTQYPGNNGTINSGILTSSLSPLQGTGPIKKGPYIRNCTNFIPNSIGAKIDGFNAEVGDKEDIGTQGNFHVDSYTQYNQGGIGVSITNGAYAQLVSIFTICTDRAIYTGQGGQLDLTNSNSSFGREGLVSEGIGDETTKSTDRYTAGLTTSATRGTNVVVLSGVGTFRPYTGQSIYFDKKYYSVRTAIITNPGSGYNPESPPRVSVTSPTGPGNNIPAQITANVSSIGTIESLNILTTGFQYEIENPPTITIDPPQNGEQAEATAVLNPIYYGVDSATLPSSGITTVSLVQNLNNNISTGSTAYFARQSLQIASSHSFEYIGAGNAIETARPSKGGVTIQENEVLKLDGGDVIYTSTDQNGNFRIGDGVVIDQTTGTISGAIYVKSLFSQVTPFILALGGD